MSALDHDITRTVVVLSLAFIACEPVVSVGTDTRVVTGTPGVWENVTPPGVNIAIGALPGAGANGGATTIAADPSRPGTLYMAFASQGVWRSRDYGVNWTRIAQQYEHVSGGILSIGIPTDGSYVLTTSTDLPGAAAWRSTDEGDTWTAYTDGAACNNIILMSVSPYDPNDVVGANHGSCEELPDLHESQDGGKTWSDQGRTGNLGPSAAYEWIDSNTLLATGEGGTAETGGTWLGVRADTHSPWTWGNARVSMQQRFDGGHQIFVDTANNAIYNGGVYGMFRSTDTGRTWTQLDIPVMYSAVVVGTATRLYSFASYGSPTGLQPNLMHATRTDGTDWVADHAPEEMRNGALSATVVFDGTHYVIVSAHGFAGIWRFVEP